MSIQEQNYFDLLPNECIDRIISFLPKNDGMKLGLTSRRLYAVAIAQEQALLKKEIKSILKVFNPEKKQILDPSQLPEFQSVSEKISLFIKREKILSSLNGENCLLSFMIEIQSDFMALNLSMASLIEQRTQQIQQIITTTRV